jgi:hypothetical protein
MLDKKNIFVVVGKRKKEKERKREREDNLSRSKVDISDTNIFYFAPIQSDKSSDWKTFSKLLHINL